MYKRTGGGFRNLFLATDLVFTLIFSGGCTKYTGPLPPGAKAEETSGKHSKGALGVRWPWRPTETSEPGFWEGIYEGAKDLVGLDPTKIPTPYIGDCTRKGFLGIGCRETATPMPTATPT